jgi:hypothetical protein
MTIDELRRQIERRLTEAREEAERLQAAWTRSDMGLATRRRSTPRSPTVDHDVKRVGGVDALLEAQLAKPFWRRSPAGP